MNCFPSNGGAAAVITGQPPARHCVGTVHGGARAGQSCEESWRSILAHPGGRPSQWCRGIGGCTSVATPTALEEHCAGNVRRLQLQLPHALHVAALPRSPTLSLVQRLIRKAPHAYTTHTRIRSITQIHTRAASAQRRRCNRRFRRPGRPTARAASTAGGLRITGAGMSLPTTGV